MRIEMKTLAAGPFGILEVGKVYQVEKDIGQPLIDGGFAVAPTDPNAEAEAVPAAPPAAEGGDKAPKPRTSRRRTSLPKA